VDPRPAAPAFVQFYPTLRCNLACEFCFNRGLPPLPDVESADFARMLDRLRAAGVTTFDLLGGEPTEHARLDELVAAIAARAMSTTLSTNGRGDLALVERLEDRHGPGTLRVGVSVNEESVPARLGEYIAARMPMLKSVCGRGWRLPPAAAVHLARPGAEYFLIFRDPLSPGDLGHCLSYPEYAERLAALRREHPRAAGVACDGFVPRPDSEAGLREVRCPAGTTKLSVLPDGSVFPCYLLFSRPEFRLGNLLADPFERIWDHPRLDFFRTFRGNVCPREGCAHHASCHGGCPAVSLLVAGDIAAPDPRCVEPGQSTSCASRKITLDRASKKLITAVRRW
jgi:radical SAM protein with 4Fe4S-binding SPASM domain